MDGFIQLHRSLLRHWVSSDPETLSIWISILLNASFKKHKESHRGGFVELDVGELLFSRPQWAARLKIPPSNLVRRLEHLKDDGMIDIKPYGKAYTLIKVINWEAYQPTGEVYPLKKTGQENGQGQSLISQGVRGDLKQGNGQQTDNERTSIKNKGNKGKRKDIYCIFEPSEKEILDHWNTKGIIQHSQLEDIKSAIKAVLAVNTKENIILAIDRYSKILKDDSYFFGYKWSLDKFLARKGGITAFLDGGEKWENYKAQKKATSSAAKGSNMINFEQRQYEDTYFDDFYSNLKKKPGGNTDKQKTGGAMVEGAGGGV